MKSLIYVEGNPRKGERIVRERDRAKVQQAKGLLAAVEKHKSRIGVDNSYLSTA